MSQTVLIADNNAFYRQVLGDFFRSEGYEVVLASDGVEALERVTAGGVDIILLDLIMPRIDGARLCRYLRAHEHLRSIPIVILSGILADEIDGIDSIHADAYVAKMPMDLLQPMLRKVFASIGAGREAPVLEGFEKMYRREVVLELLEERRCRDAIQDSLSEGIVELSDDRRILRTNRAFDRLFERPGSSLLSARIESLFGESRGAVSALFDALGAGGSDLAGAVIRRRGRHLRVRIHSLAPLHDVTSGLPPTIRKISKENPKVRLIQEDRMPGFVLLIEDVTDQLRAQEERDLFRERMSRSERMSALGMFVGGAAHELNNPLTAVLGYAQLLGARDLPDDVKDCLGKIEAGAHRCKSIVGNLLTFSHRGRPERRLCAAEDLVEAAIEECRPRAAAAGVDLEARKEGPLPPVEVNGGEIVQAVGAVLDNALRAAADGGAPGMVRARVFRAGDSVVIEIADSGPGISRPILDKIFDPFFTTREVGKGKGLGLSVAYGIVRSHAGRISARNQPAGGACVTIEIPAAREALGSEGEAKKRAEGGGAAGRPGRILVVDDEPVVLDLITDSLGGLHRVETAVDGREGLAMATRETYDVILLDMKMPDMTGREMYEALAAISPEAAERVIFTTGDTLQVETQAFLGALSNPCLAKPFSLDALAEAVDRVMAAAKPG